MNNVDKKTKFDKIMMETAEIWSNLSYCKRKKVGAVLSKDNRILATGYNGTLPGTDNNCEDILYRCPFCGFESTIFKNFVDINKKDNTHLCQSCKTILKIENSEKNFNHIKKFYITNGFTLHAEQNILAFCSKYGISTKDTTLYITLSPCKECAKLIAQSGIKRVVYKNNYKDTSGIDFLKNYGIEVNKIILGGFNG